MVTCVRPVPVGEVEGVPVIPGVVVLSGSGQRQTDPVTGTWSVWLELGGQERLCVSGGTGIK